jgi:CHAD domain-containing protein
LEGEDWGIVGPGLRRIYRRGRRSFHAAVGEPSTENLHEWRKRAKDLWYAYRILRPSWPQAMGGLTDEADKLSDLLGDDHDLAVLAATARERSHELDAGALDELLAAVEARRAELQGDAIPLGHRLYAEKPGAFVARNEGWWRAWRGVSPLAVA